MQEHDKLSTRLALILTKLNQGERFSIDDLADEFNVSKRTIQRDLKERLNYLPISKDEYNCYYIEEYCLGKLNFDDIKNFAILSGLKGMYPSFDNNFIVDLLNVKLNKPLLVKGHKFEDIDSKSNEFEIIQTAIVANIILNFTYNNKHRTVEPYKLVNTNGIWYLSASENNILKTYTFTKISNISLSKDNFIVNKEFLKTIEENKATWFSQDKLEVILKIDKTASEYFLRRELLPAQKIVEHTDDNLIVSTTVSYDEEILKIIRYWIPHIRILEPTHLQEKLEDGMKEYLKI